MLFDRAIAPETYAVVRFGLGFPARNTPLTAERIVERLRGPDDVAKAHPFLPFKEAVDLTFAIRKARKVTRKTEDKSPLVKARRAQNEAFARTLRDDFVRAVETDDPFRERLYSFWLNHFTARPKNGAMRAGHAGYGADAIRPHLSGRFADMLKAVVTHPFMLAYLDQRGSIGPNSVVGLRQGKGLNENLAREVIELHTIGAGAAYSQTDVTQFAELLTGLTYDRQSEFVFHPGIAEPGAETVLGQSYGGDTAALSHIEEALEDLAVHPGTAQHLAQKLAAHFVADEPDAGLVRHMAAAYLESRGELMALYAAMLEHPAAWSGFGAKVKWPVELMATTYRALGLRVGDIDESVGKRIRKASLVPLSRMGMIYARPPGPDGWPDNTSAWVTAHSLAARIGWSMAVADKLGKRAPDPREFVFDALGDAAGVNLIQAANGAETRVQGISLILASAEFNRR